jgi:dihydroflavonol-4-reductase
MFKIARIAPLIEEFMKVLVTGANGFVGSHICRRLAERGDPVRALVRKDSDRRALNGVNVEFATGDILDPASLDRAMEGCDQVYHLAAIVRFFTTDPEGMRAANTLGTKNVLDAAKKAGVKRIIHTSTAAILKHSVAGDTADESMLKTEKEVVGAYELTKLEADQVAMNAAKDGLPVVVVNLTAPLGPWDTKPSPVGMMILQFLRGKFPAYTDSGLNVINVRDAAEGHLLVGEKGKVGERYIIGGENLSLKAFLDILSELSGVPSPKMKVPYALTIIGGLWGELTGRITGKEPLACMASVRMGKYPHYVKTDKAKTDLGFRAGPLKAALKEEIDWFRAQGMV